MNIMLVNASPRPSGGNSAFFLAQLQQLQDSGDILKTARINTASEKEEDPLGILQQDAVVFFFPLYADGIPSHLLEWMVEAEQDLRQAGLHSHIYAVVNCGFYEGKQCRWALEIMRNWCARCGLVWNGGLGIGAGEMLGSMQNVPLGAGPKKSLGKAFTLLADAIEHKTEYGMNFISPDFPRFAYKAAGEFGFMRQGRNNGLSLQDMRAAEEIRS